MKKINVVDKYIELYSIRDEDGFIWKMQKWIEKSQLVVGEKDKQQSDYRTFTSRAVSDTQQADLLHNMPIYDYIPLSKEARAWVFYLKEAWKRLWKIDETDRKILEVVEDAWDLGSWILYQWWKIEKRKVSVPYFDNGNLAFEKGEREEYFWVYSEFVPIENIMFDWTTIENSNECIWIKYWDKQDFINAHELNKLYTLPDELPALNHYIEAHKKLPKIKNAIGEEDLVQELRYYNKSEDKLIITANWAEVYETAIPHTHKELPFVKFDNHKYRDRFIQMGSYEMLDEPEKYIDAIRSQSVDATKANIWFNAVPKDSDFNPEMTKVGAFSFIEMEDPSSIKHIWNTIQPSQLWDLENRASNDIIVLTGVDYRQQVLGSSWETAKKTSSRNAAQQKRTNKILKKNSFNFYNRLAKLRLADMQFMNSIKETELPLKGNNQTKNGFEKIQNWYWLFTLPKDALKGKFDIVLQTESLLWNSTEKDKENYLNFFQVFGNLADEAGKPIINPNRMVEIAGQKIGVDTDSLTEKEEINKDGKQIVDELKSLRGGQDMNAANESNPNFIPWANRANNAWWVNVIGWWNTAVDL